MSTYKITLLNRDETVLEVASDATILDVAEENGFVLPYGCRYGGCITCAARLISGEIDQPEAVGWKGYMAEAGYILTCVAYPLSDCEIEVGVESHDAGLYRNPFKVG